MWFCIVIVINVNLVCLSLSVLKIFKLIVDVIIKRCLILCNLSVWIIGKMVIVLLIWLGIWMIIKFVFLILKL